jgi:hypothetical protein
MIIDGHSHAAREFSSLRTLLEILNKNNVDKVILCPSLKNKTDLNDPPKIFMFKKERSSNKLYSSNKFIRLTYKFLKENGNPNYFVSQLRSEAPDRIIQFYWLDFENDNMIEELYKSRENYDYKGLKIHQSWTPFRFDSEIFQKVVLFAEEESLFPDDITNEIMYDQELFWIQVLYAQVISIAEINVPIDKIADSIISENYYYVKIPIRYIKHLKGSPRNVKVPLKYYTKQTSYNRSVWGGRYWTINTCV